MQTKALVRDQAFEKLRDAIITGKLAPGRRLIERELCEAWNISRTSVREALRRVEAEGLARFVSQRGLTVALLSRKEIIEIYEVRASLEPIIFQRFAEIASDKEIATLREMFENHPEMPRENDSAEVMTQKIMEWGNTLSLSMGHVMNVVNHEVIRSISRQLIARVAVLRTRAFTQPGRLEQTLDEIEAVVIAIERRRPHETADMARIYVRNSRNAVLSMLNVKESDPISQIAARNAVPHKKADL